MKTMPPVSRPVFLALAVVMVTLSPDASWSQDDAPWKLFLKGEDLKRVTGLEVKIQQCFHAGQYDEGVKVTRETFELRARLQGPDHWQTKTAKCNLDLMEKLDSLPKEAQAEVTQATRLDRTDLVALRKEGKYRQALPVAEQIVATYERHLGENCYLVATALNVQGMIAQHLGKFSQAETLFRRAVAISSRTYGEDHPSTAAASGNLAIALESQDKYREARTIKERVLQIDLRSYGEESASVAVAYSNLGLHHERVANFVDSEKSYRKCLEILDRLTGDHLERKATGHNNLAGVLSRLARYAEAESEYQKALEMTRELYKDPKNPKAVEDHPEIALVCNNMAVCLADQSKYVDAEKLYRKALEIYRNAWGDEHYRTRQTMANLAVILNGQSKHLDAEILLRRVLVGVPKGKENRSTGTIYLTLAHNLQAQGKKEEAYQVLMEARSIFLRVMGPEHPDTIFVEVDLASTLTKAGRYTEAEPLFRSAVASLKKSLGNHHPNVAQALGNEAANLYFLGKFTEAATIHREVLSIFQEQFGNNHTKTAWAYKNLVQSLWALGQYEDAEKLGVIAAQSHEAARRQASVTGLERSVMVSESSPLTMLAAISARNGKASDAWRILESSLARGLFDDLGTTSLWSPAERQQERTLKLKITKLDDQISALLNPIKVTSESREKVDALTQERRKIQAELAVLHAELLKQYGPPAGEVYDLAKIQARIPEDTALVAWVDLDGQPTAHNPSGEHWACMVRRTGSPLWVRLPGTGVDKAWTPADTDLAARVRQECAARPGAGTPTDPNLPRQLYDQRLAPLETLFAARENLPAVRHLVVLPSSQLRGVPIEVLTETVHPGRFTLSYAPSGTIFAWLQERRDKSQKTGQAPKLAHILAVGDPILPEVKSSDPLPKPPEGGIFLTRVKEKGTADRGGLKRNDILLQYGPTTLHTVKDLHDAIEAAQKQAIIPVKVWREGKTLDLEVGPGELGVPSELSPAQAVHAQRELDQLMRHSSASEFAPLRGAEREVHAVTRIFRTTTIFKGSDASEQNLRKLADEDRLADYRYLHFATHGMLESRSPLRSSLLMSQDHLPDPLKQLAAGKPAYDGRITAEQMLRGWRLDADLVTLSACDTGLGTYATGEGYLGFSQALFLAGARSLVLSLWKVDDVSTALLMTRFYENLVGARPGLPGPMSKAQALAEAKVWLRGLRSDEAEQVGGGLIRGLDTETARGEIRAKPAKQTGAPPAAYPYAQPYYWAGFILVGDPK